MDPDTSFDLLTMAEVAALLHCSKAHVSNAVAGRLDGCPPLPALHLGRRLLVRRTSLEAWLKQSERDRIQRSPERARKSA